MNKNMNVKKMILNAILIAIGALLHQITPALGLPMQPDFAISMLFIIILINKDYKTTLISSIIMGIITALTTKFPVGQLPNIIDKLITAHVIYFMFKVMGNKVSDNIKIISALSFGTIVSGLTFLLSASIIVGLPGSFLTLVTVVVLPATIMNIILGTILYKSIGVALKVTGTLASK
ncbi:MAG: tryptophan transporter [Clostridium sp.]|uniref:tryptophan transporter n=1 Tax=Clostridium sp. TaxID=1506 RepID=UPI002A7610E7|nr:tryptophan transporter [Clostridium sp.]MCI6691270.1 tryptophan transporter [Clostridium sp.]MDY2630303.1 tryptophan transporter [Clostridium sp.]